MTALDAVLAAFAALAALTGAASVLSRKVVHASMWLVVCLGSLAGVYLVLGAEVVALVQLLVYVGAVVVLVLFALMLTSAPLRRADLDSPGPVRALAALIGLAAAALIGAALTVGQPTGAASAVVDGRAEPLALELFTTWVLGFELISVLLLAALIGAVAGQPGAPGGEPVNLLIPNLLVALLAGLGLYAVIARRHAVMVLIGAELLVNAGILLLVLGDLRHRGAGGVAGTGLFTGQVGALFAITIAAAEIGLALAIVLVMFRVRGDSDLRGLDGLGEARRPRPDQSGPDGRTGPLPADDPTPADLSSPARAPGPRAGAAASGRGTGEGAP